MYRDHTCGELRISDVGKKVTLAGWVQKARKLGGMTFIDLRDRYGITQLVVEADAPEDLVTKANSLGREFVIQALGAVVERSSKNPKMPTGDIEIRLEAINILNESLTPPFTIEDVSDGGDDLRLRYRYLDLRRNPLQKALQLRHRICQEVRSYLDSNDFLEIETPFLINSTPEGARDFVVPSRMNPGTFYALPQSPQTLKQSLMVAGMDRYFQIVKCFRDEDLRADRQPEFTQIDCEMSFVEQEDVLNMFEGMMRTLFKNVLDVTIPNPIPRMSWFDGMDKYGSDKPDIRFGMTIHEITALAQGHGFGVFDSVPYVGAIAVEGAAGWSRKQLDELTEWVKRPQVGAKGLVNIKLNEDGTVKSSVDKFFSPEDLKAIAEAVDAAIAKYSFLISDVNELRRFLYAEITVYSEPTVALIAEKYKNSDWWSKRKADYSFPKEYSERYYDYMCNKPSWGITAINEIDRSTDKTMNAIVDPQLGAEDERIGLIFGYVQSGKTAHYISLINKAYDAGYKIIIVLTGMHDSLRSQTQSRIDEEVLGYETSIDYFLNSALEKNAIGVGIGFQNQIRALPMLQSLTTRDQKGDFSKSTLGVKMTNPFIIVTKKNAVVLRNILKYFNNAPFAETENGKKYIPATYPALIIDDEADQASVNTKAVREKDGSYKKDYDPSTINGLIRKLLRVFKTRSYVGYTATPYANIFIDPKTPDTEYGSDLYPRDFIFRAPRSNMYVGAREFFGLAGAEDAPTMPLFRPIIKGASYLGKGTKVDDPVGPIPDDLKLAVRYFYISTALRNLRGQINKPNSMLVHVVRFVGQQNIIKRKVQDYRDELESYIRYNDMETCEEFHRIWNSDYLPTHSDLQSSFPRYMDGCTMP
jgi:aspartyl-tRNA synthetase